MKGKGTWHDDMWKALGTVKNYHQNSSQKSLSPKTPLSLQVRKDTDPVANCEYSDDASTV